MGRGQARLGPMRIGCRLSAHMQEIAWDDLTVSFIQIEQIIRRELPAWTRGPAAFWSNTSSCARARTEAGFQVTRRVCRQSRSGSYGRVLSQRLHQCFPHRRRAAHLRRNIRGIASCRYATTAQLDGVVGERRIGSEPSRPGCVPRPSCRQCVAAATGAPNRERATISDRDSTPTSGRQAQPEVSAHRHNPYGADVVLVGCVKVQAPARRAGERP